MQTADWALVISLCSVAIALASFGWNVWSKFIYPKPRIRVTFGFMVVVGRDRSEDENILSLSATNMGPGPVTLYSAVVRDKRGRFRRKGWGLLNPLHNYPIEKNRSVGPFGGGLPKKIDVGESFAVHFVPDHEALAGSNIVQIGFSDTFGRRHWAHRKALHQTRPSIRNACDKSGKTYKV